MTALPSHPLTEGGYRLWARAMTALAGMDRRAVRIHVLHSCGTGALGLPVRVLTQTGEHALP